MWEDRIAYSAWVCTEQKVAKKIAKWSKKDKTDKIAALLKSEQALSVVVNEGTAQQKDDELLAQVWQTVPGIYGPVALDGGYVVLQVKEFLPAQPKALKEVKGLVIASYQDVLEQEWVKSLSEKFEVKVNSEVKAQLFQTLK
jgi:peptidyl-prolyl cis-trans isomerase SurA